MDFLDDDMRTLYEIGSQLLEEADAMKDDLVEWRRTFHQFPEVATEEYATAGRIENILGAVPGIEVVKGFGMPTCVVARIGCDMPGGAIGFKIEIDAVGVRETTGLPFSSFDERAAHVQGHDAHMATAIGAAKLLAAHASQLQRPAVFIFQPGDESRGGAKILTEAGVIDEFGIERMLCLHWIPSLPYGQIFTNKGGVTANSSKLHIGLTGPGGHGSTPHLTSDPLFLASQLQIELQSMMTREINYEDRSVLSFGRIESGDVYNVIPTETHLWGTVRSEGLKTIEFLRARIEEITKARARIAHVAATVEYMLNYAQTMNDAQTVSEIFKRCAPVFGSETIVPLRAPLLMGEDFSFYSALVPSCLMFLGTGMEYGLYHSRYDIPEHLLPFAAAWCAYLALEL